MSDAGGLLQWLVDNLLPILFGVIALGIVVFLHELGHFIVAKLSGIRVEVFSIGFPPKIWGFRRGETEYRISWIFFGGYVKLAGMDFGEGVDPRSVRDGYFASPLRRRIAVCAAGPFMNILSAFIIYCFLWGAGFPLPVNMESTVVGSVMEDSPAEAAGLKPGDRILEINGKPVERWEDVTKAIVYSTKPAVELAVQRGEERFVRRIVPRSDKRLKVKLIGILPPELISVDVIEDSPAGKAGMRSGDFIVSADGERVYSWNSLTKLIRSRNGSPVRLGLLRRGKPVEVTVVPAFNKELGYPAIGVRLRMKVSMEELRANGLVVYLHRDPFSWISGNVREMYLTIRGLIMRALSPRGLSSPIGIVHVMGVFMKAGLRQFLYILAFISVNLAVVNLLPVPVLDGGHILLGLIEGVKKSPLSVKTMTVIQNTFLVLLLALMLFLVGNDIMRFWGERISRLVRGGRGAPPTPTAVDKP